MTIIRIHFYSFYFFPKLRSFGVKNLLKLFKFENFKYSSFSRLISFWMHTSLRILIGSANKQNNYERFI